MFPRSTWLAAAAANSNSHRKWLLLLLFGWVVTAWEKSVRGPMHEQVRGGELVELAVRTYGFEGK